MKPFRALASILGTAALTLASFSLASPAYAAVSCHNINAKGVGQDLGGGRTRAEIHGGGLLNGSTEGNFTIGSATGTTAGIGGTVAFTTHQGTLTVAIAGTFDVANGDFTASGPVSAATGKLAGATGSLSLTGNEDFSDGSFTEKISGNICLDLAP